MKVVLFVHHGWCRMMDCSHILSPLCLVLLCSSRNGRKSMDDEHCVSFFAERDGVAA